MSFEDTKLELSPQCPTIQSVKYILDIEANFTKKELRNGVEIERCFVAIRPKPGLIGRVLLDSSFAILSFIKAISGWRPDIILATSPSLPACLPVAAAKAFYRCPSVLSLQDILPEAAVQTGLISNKFAIKVFEQLEKFAYHNATKISVITPSFAQNLTSKGVPADKLECISNWVDTSYVRPLPKENNAFRQAHNLKRKVCGALLRQHCSYAGRADYYPHC